MVLRKSERDASPDKARWELVVGRGARLGCPIPRFCCRKGGTELHQLPLVTAEEGEGSRVGPSFPLGICGALCWAIAGASSSWTRHVGFGLDTEAWKGPREQRKGRVVAGMPRGGGGGLFCCGDPPSPPHS